MADVRAKLAAAGGVIARYTTIVRLACTGLTAPAVAGQLERGVGHQPKSVDWNSWATEERRIAAHLIATERS